MSNNELSTAQLARPPQRPATPDLDEAELQCFRYRPGFLLSERSGTTRSWVWDYGFDITKALDNGANKHRRWVCHRCLITKVPHPGDYAEKGTHHMMDHLFEEHKILAPTGEKKGPKQEAWEKSNNKSIPDATALPRTSIAQYFELNPHTPRDQAVANTFIKRFDKGFFQRLLVEYIVGSNKPFTEAEDPRLRRIFDYLNPSVGIQRAAISAHTVRARIFAEFETHYQTIKEVLRRAPGLIHISFDGWTARNRMPLYGIACFFRDERGRAVKLILGVPELAARHTGVNIANEVYTILEAFGITSKFGYAMLDNADNNDTAMAELGEKLGFDGSLRRGRCFGHSINLAAVALLFGNHADAIEDEQSGAHMISDQEWKLWVRRGPVGTHLTSYIPFVLAVPD